MPKSILNEQILMIVNNEKQSNQTNLSSMPGMNESGDSTGPYIPISECITGVRARGAQRAFTFDPKNIVMSTRRSPFDRADRNQLYMSQPHIKLSNVEFCETESNISNDKCKSHSQSNIRDWPVAKTFTKLARNPNRNGLSEEGPPVPPRPPKTFTMGKDPYQGPKIQEPVEPHDSYSCYTVRAPRRVGAPPSPGRSYAPNKSTVRYSEDEEDHCSGHHSMQYCNLPPALPPPVDRALKPRRSSHISTHFGHFGGYQDEAKADGLQYLDLDLHSTKPVPSKPQDRHQRKIDVNHGKSLSTVDVDSAYKTVDFVKTEAFNITRQDAEASRSSQH